MQDHSFQSLFITNLIFVSVEIKDINKLQNRRCEVLSIKCFNANWLNNAFRYVWICILFVFL